MNQRVLAGEMPHPDPGVQAAVAWLGKTYKETRSAYDWIPAATALALFCKSGWGGSITASDFGWAMRIAFSGGIDCEHVHRRSCGKTLWGWSGVTGPGSEVTTDAQFYNRKRKWRPQ